MTMNRRIIIIWACYIILVACSQRSERFVAAIESCSISNVKKNIYQNARTYRDNYGRNIAHIAALKCDDPEVVAWVVEEYPDLLHEADRQGRTVLESAFGEGDYEKVLLLVRQGARVDYHYEIRGAKVGIIDAAINLGSSGDTVDLLLKKGAPVHRDNFYDALNMANAEIASLILSHLDKQILNQESSLGRLPIEIAIDRGMPELVSLLLDHGANPETPIQGFDSAEAYAISKGEVEIAEILRRR